MILDGEYPRVQIRPVIQAKKLLLSTQLQVQGYGMEKKTASVKLLGQKQYMSQTLPFPCKIMIQTVQIKSVTKNLIIFLGEKDC